MELSPEEKKRIYEEEKARFEAQDKVKKESEAKKKKEENKNTKQGCIGCLTIIVIIFIIALASGWFKSSDKLTASVTFTGTKFVIINLEDFDWTNVEMRVNAKYVLKTQRIKTYESYTVGAMQFTKVSDGTRFNPLTMKPNKIQIWCDTPKGTGVYIGRWE